MYHSEQFEWYFGCHNREAIKYAKGALRSCNNQPNHRCLEVMFARARYLASMIGWATKCCILLHQKKNLRQSLRENIIQ